MKFNIKKAVITGLIGFFASIPLIILYALLPDVLGMDITPNIDHSWYFILGLTLICFVYGSQMKNAAQNQSPVYQRESSASLRWFFGVVGVISFALNIFLMAAAMSLSLPFPFFAAVSTVLALVYVYFAIVLPRYLNPAKVSYIFWFIFVSFGMYLFSAVEDYLMLGTTNLLTFISAALVTWYLYFNIKRLSGESSIPIPSIQ